MTDLDFGGSQKGMVFEDGQYRAAPGMGRHPVVGVSWYGALKYCNWLTIHSGLGEDACAYTEGPDPEKWHPSTLTDEEWLNGFSDIERQAWLDAGVGYRLPMNSYNTTTGRFNEFYAAAAWDGAANRVFGFGRDTLTGRDANFARAGTPFEGGTTPVGYFDGSDHGGAFATNPNQNRNGIHDLSGNAWEWSNDTTGHPDYRALFGGAFDGDEDSLKTTFRGSLNPYRVCDNVGFRVAITPTQPKRPAAPPPRPAL
jgi:formylglycine-generating enzyme required for sulfatase activity